MRLEHESKPDLFEQLLPEVIFGAMVLGVLIALMGHVLA